MHDKVPFLVASSVMSVTPVLPGPTRDEYVGLGMTLVGLLIRELVYWLRNRGAAK